MRTHRLQYSIGYYNNFKKCWCSNVAVQERKSTRCAVAACIEAKTKREAIHEGLKAMGNLTREYIDLLA